MSGGKGGSDSQTVTQRTQIPSFLQPLARQSSETSARALRGLERELLGSRGGLNLPQGARVQNGRVVRDISVPGQSRGTRSQFGNPFSGLRGLQGGTDLPPSVLDNMPANVRRKYLNATGRGSTTQTVDLGAASDFRQPGNDPNLVAGFDPLEEEAFGLAEARARGAGDFIPTFQDQLLSTAQGDFLPDQSDFLFGGDAFNEAVDATTRRVQPSILSTFGTSGRGTGGLAQQAIAQAISDSFAGLFNQERNRFVNRLGQERGLQQQAIGALPDAATVDVSMLQNIGGNRRAQAQREIDAPITALERLAAAAQGTVPFTSLLGQSRSQPIHRNTTAGVLGGGLGGLGAAQAFFPGEALMGTSLGPMGLAGFGLGGALLGGLLS